MLNRFVVIAVLLFSLRIFARAADEAATLIEKGHFKRAEVVLKQRLQKNPNDATTYCELSKVDLAFQRWDEAIEHAEKAVSLDDKSADTHVALLDSLGAKLGAPGTGMFQRVSLGHRFKNESAVALQKD